MGLETEKRGFKVSPTSEGLPPQDASGCPTKDYEGLLLHILSPRLARYIYPVLMNSWFQTITTLVTAGILTASTLPFFSIHFPRLWTGLSVLLHVNSIQRVVLIDLRLFRLQCRQFETLYLLCNWLLGAAALTMVSQAVSYNVAVWVVGLVIIFLDSIRLPSRTSIMHALGFSCYSAIMVMAIFFRRLRFYDYDQRFPGTTVSILVFMMGRQLTIGIFCFKYAVKLMLYPDAYVMLRKPVRAHPPGVLTVVPWEEPRVQEEESPPPSPRPVSASQPPQGMDSKAEGRRTTTDNSNNNRSPSLLLHYLLPRTSAAVVEAMLMSHRADVVSVGLLVLSSALFSPPALLPHMPLGLAYAALFGYVLAIRCLLLLDLSVLRLLTKQFESYYLAAAWLGALYCITGSGMITRDLIATSYTHFLITAGTVLLLDAISIHPRIKIFLAGWYGFGIFGWVIIFTLRLPRFTDFDRVIVFADLKFSSVAAFLVGRLVTLSVFFVKYTAGLWLRPGVYIVVGERLSRQDERPFLVSTLRSLASFGSESRVGAAEETSHTSSHDGEQGTLASKGAATADGRSVAGVGAALV